MNGDSIAELIANNNDNEAIVFSPPDNYSLLSNIYFLFGGFGVYIIPPSNGSSLFSTYSTTLPLILF